MLAEREIRAQPAGQRLVGGQLFNDRFQRRVRIALTEAFRQRVHRVDVGVQGGEILLEGFAVIAGVEIVQIPFFHLLILLFFRMSYNSQ